MGGRGSSSSTRTQGFDEAKSYLQTVIQRFSHGGSAGNKDIAEMAEAVLPLVGSEKLTEMNADSTVNRLRGALRDYAFTGYGALSNLNNALQGFNRPLGMSKERWDTIGDLVREANAKGYSNAEMAGLWRFDDALYEKWR